MPRPGTAVKPAMGSLPGHEVAGIIARGGMGAVYLARQQALEREVAVKVMTAQADSPEMAERFRREALVLGKLAHPNIVPIYDIGTDDQGQLFYTMKLVKGRTLQHILMDLRQEDGAALRTHGLVSLLTVFHKVCDALAFAHSQGVIHRDLKPENVMVGEFGEVLVMDWGLARTQDAETGGHGEGETFDPELSASAPLRASESALTLQGSIMGTPQYMSPEQAMGQIDELDERSDIFSLGGILYAILTLRPPVEGQTLEEVLRKVTGAQITSPVAFQASLTTRTKARRKGELLDPKELKPLPHVPGGRIPAALSSVVMKALQLDKQQRYQTVAEFSADIEAYQAGFATKAEQAGLGTQLVLLIKRHRGIFSTAAAAWLLITALAVWFVLNLRAKERRAVAGERSAVTEAARAANAEAVALQQKETARQALARSALSLAEAARREDNGPDMQAALNEVPDDLRNSTWKYLLDESDTSIARVRTGSTGLGSVAADPRRPGVFAVTDGYGKVTFLEVRSGARLLGFDPGFTQPNTDKRYVVAISPDGERVAVGHMGGSGIVIHSARDGKKLGEWEAPSVKRLEFSPNGKLLLETEITGRLLNMRDALNGRLRWAYAEGGSASGTFTPDGQQVLTHGDRERFRLVNAQDGTPIRKFSSNICTAFAVRPDGQIAVTGEANGRLTGVDLKDGHHFFQFSPHGHRILRLAFVPDGGRFVSVALLGEGRQSIQLWDSNTGALLQSLLGGAGAISDAGVHPLSGELLVSGTNPRIWSLTGAPEKWTLRGRYSSVVFWGSDDLLFGAASDTSSPLLDLKTGSPVTLWKPPRIDYRGVSVSADGRFAAVGLPLSTEPIVLLRHSRPAVEQVATFKPQSNLRGVILSPNGDRLVVLEGAEGIRLLATATGTQPIALDRRDLKVFNNVGWISSQRLVGLATAVAVRGKAGSEERIVLWDTATGKIVRTATNRTAMNTLAVAPDGRSFAEVGVDKLVRIRDAETLAVRQEFRAHDGPITAVAFHPAKPILASASTDLTVRLWSLATGRRLEEFRGPLLPPVDVAFSPNGRLLGCASMDTTTRVWEPMSLSDQPDPDQADGWEDLLDSLTPAAVAQTGNGWRMEDGAVFCPDRHGAMLPLPGNFAGASYKVRVKLRQLATRDIFFLNLPVADRMVGFSLDGDPDLGYDTGLVTVNGTSGKDLPGTLHGKQVQDSAKHDLEVTVRLETPNARIITRLDGQPLHEWSGPTAALRPHPNWASTPPGALALGASAADWVVYAVKAKRAEK